MSPRALGRKNMPTLAMPSMTNAATITAPGPAAGCRNRAGHGSAANAAATTGTARIRYTLGPLKGRERGTSGGADLGASGGLRVSLPAVSREPEHHQVGAGGPGNREPPQKSSHHLLTSQRVAT